MKHPFDLESPTLQTLDLDFLEPLPKEEMQSLDGSRIEMTTLALGEQGGTFPDPFPDLPDQWQSPSRSSPPKQ